MRSSLSASANPTQSLSASFAPPLAPSTPARKLRTRAPQQPSPGFVLTRSDSRRRITRDNGNPSSRPTSPNDKSPTSSGPASKKGVWDDDGPDQIVSKTKKNDPKVSPSSIQFSVSIRISLPHSILIRLLLLTSILESHTSSHRETGSQTKRSSSYGQWGSGLVFRR